MTLRPRPHLHHRPRTLPAPDHIHNLKINRVVLPQHLAHAHLDVLHPGFLASVVAREVVVEAADVPDEVGRQVLAVLGDRLPGVAQLEDLFDLVVGWVGHFGMFWWFGLFWVGLWCGVLGMDGWMEGIGKN